MPSLSTESPAHILVATDLSDAAGRAVERAAALAEVHRARLTAVHVLPGRAGASAVASAGEALQEHLDRYSPGSYDDIAVRTGDTNSVIVGEAADRDADLLVIGSHGRNRMIGALLGGTAELLARSSRVPVLVVKNTPTDGYRSVLLAVDTSPTADHAARAGTILTPSADHTLVHAAVVPGERMLRTHGVTESGLHELRRSGRDSAGPHIEELAHTLRPSPVRTVVESGQPAPRIIETARALDADLVVVGSGRHTRIGYALLGTTGQGVLLHARSDVLIVPEPAASAMRMPESGASPPAHLNDHRPQAR
ncbi:universal stress protein [Nocardia carnea]|uniref:Universal stress protein n=1 Tax=Nocardia carnea TaxID=37328 RepID=A0ABW7TN55_9NOCA|nr:universal stress protein [Nocardia carnea]